MATSTPEMRSFTDRGSPIPVAPARPFVRYVLLGAAPMASAEFQGNVLLRGNVAGFILAMGLYAALSAIAYGIGTRVRSRHADLWFYALGGLFGLLVIEWLFVGFYPGSGKGGIHAAMFANWAGVFTIPRLFTAGRGWRTMRVRRGVTRTMILYSVGAPLLVLASPVARGAKVAILMAAYSIVLSFQFERFVVRSRRGRGVFRCFNVALMLGAVVNLMWW